MTHYCTENGLCAPVYIVVLLMVIVLSLWGASYLLKNDKLTVQQWMLVVFGVIFGVAAFLLALALTG